MAQTKAATRKFEEQLREAIAGTLHAVKSYNLPSVCSELGLATGTTEEAHSSKFSYVKNRIKEHSETALLDLARAVIERLDDPAPRLQDLLDEHALPAADRISELTRRKVLKSLDTLEDLYGELGKTVLRERLEILAPMWTKSRLSSHDFNTLEDDVEQHYIRNQDWTHAELLEECGAISCTQARFVALLESILRPEARDIDEQTALAKSLGAILAADGYTVDQASYLSGHPIYVITRRATGVRGTLKNLIFASIGPKPELILRDAVNNDVEITKHADLCLIYDRPLSSTTGLSWLTLVEWWRSITDDTSDLRAARKRLGDRLRRAIPENSPGEQAIFRVYFEEFGCRLGDKLPALIPQVYLHYDPLTQRERGNNKVLERQRMDFLLLLPNNVRVVIEVDGKHHYAVDDQASPARYAELMVEDRRLRLSGYELYRFGGAEFSDSSQPDTHGAKTAGEKSRLTIKRFFIALFERHRVL